MGYETYDDFLQSDEWQSIRIKVIDRAEHRCQICNGKKNLHVHHRTYRAEWGKESLSDLICLCSSCHHLFHTRSDKYFIKKNTPQPAKTKKQRVRPNEEKRSYRIEYANTMVEEVDLYPSSIQSMQSNPLIRKIRRI